MSKKQEKKPEEQNQDQKKIEESINKNVKIRVMPGMDKSLELTDSKSNPKFIGALIISFGVVVMLGFIIGGYFMFVKQSIIAKKDLTNDQTTEKIIEKEETNQKPSNKEDENKDGQEEKDFKKEAVIIKDSEPEFVVSSSSPDMEISSSTEESKASTSKEEINESEVFGYGIDSDGDGLSDYEEQLLGTDLLSKDSDGDNYNDLSEVKNLYNPIDSDKLYGNPNLSVFSDELFAYSFIYPKLWQLNSSASEAGVALIADNGDIITVSVQENVDNKDILEWTEEFFPDAFFTEADIEGRDGIRGIYYPNELIYYFSVGDNNNIYSIVYAPVDNSAIEYYNIYKTIIRSFELNAG